MCIANILFPCSSFFFGSKPRLLVFFLLLCRPLDKLEDIRCWASLGGAPIGATARWTERKINNIPPAASNFSRSQDTSIISAPKLNQNLTQLQPLKFHCSLSSPWVVPHVWMNLKAQEPNKTFCLSTGSCLEPRSACHKGTVRYALNKWRRFMMRQWSGWLSICIDNICKTHKQGLNSIFL